MTEAATKNFTTSDLETISLLSFLHQRKKQAYEALEKCDVAASTEVMAANQIEFC